MKKILLAIILSLGVITAKAQGTTCGTSTALPLHNSSTAQTVNTTEQWFSFVADSNSVSIGIENTGASPTSYVTAAGVHKGNCGSLTLVNSDIINPYSNIVFFVAKNLTAGTTYYLQLKRTPPTLPAVLSVNTYNLIVQHMVTYPEVCGFSPSDNSNFSNNIFTPQGTALDNAIRTYIYPSNQTIPAGPKIIPVVVHVIYQSAGNNITYNQIRWQIAAMNAALSNNYAMYDINKTPGSAAVDTRIRLCLAQSITNLGPTSWTLTNEPGVMRYNTANTGALYPDIKNASPDYTTIVNLTRNNNNPAWFPYNKVLNIWSVPGFGGFYSPPGLVGVFVDNMPNPTSTGAGITIDGIICRSECFGDITYNMAGCPSNMLMNTYLNHGTVMAHELGHYLGLYHTFEGKTPCLGKNLYNASADDCSLEGDQVCDTPPCTLTGTPLAPISYNGGPVSAVCGAPEMVENYMSYSYDTYMNTFTLYQALRMQAMLNVVPMRWDLWQPLNLASVGVSTAGCQTFLTAGFKFSPQLACAGADVQFSTPGGYDFSAVTWNWNFGDGTTSPLQNPIHKFASNGTYTVTLTASFGGQSTTCSGTINIGPTATLLPLVTGGADVCDGTSAVVRVRFANSTPPYNLKFSNGMQTFTFNNVSVNPGSDKDFFIPVTSAANTITILSFSDANCNGAFSGSNVFTVRRCCGDLVSMGNFEYGGGSPNFTTMQGTIPPYNEGGYTFHSLSGITTPLGSSMYINGPCGATQTCPPLTTKTNVGSVDWDIFNQSTLASLNNVDYLFSFDALSYNIGEPVYEFVGGTQQVKTPGASPILLKITIKNGAAIFTKIFQLDQDRISNKYVWNHFTYKFTMAGGPLPGGTSIKLQQITNFAGDKYDYYIDNISLRSISTTPPTITANITNSNQCTAPCNGSTSVSASGSTGPYTFSWSSGISGATATALCPNTYTVSVSDNNACVNATLVAVNGSISASATPVPANICIGATSAITAAGSGGTAPYTYSWSTGATTAGISVTPAVSTTYTVTVTDNKGCNRTATSVVNIRFAPTVASTSSSGCVGANTLTASVTSGTSPYTYTWSTGGATSVINVTPTAQTTYTVTVRDTYGCSVASTVAIVNCCAGSTITLANKTIGPIVYTTSTISMGGTITISGAVTLSGCNVLMYNDAVINVPNGASLNIVSGSWLHACTNMWKGIIVQPGGSLIVNNSLVEDAKTAVQSVNGAMFNIANATLNKNYINLDLLSYSGTHPGILKNTVISCLAGTAPTLLIAPYSTRKTLLGVNIAGVSKVTIGSAGAAGDLITFNNLARGIYETDGGTLNVYNCSFNNITPSGLGYGECITSGYGGTTPGPGNIKTLNVGGTGLMVNNFTNSTTGVLVANDHVTNILSNNFNNLTTGVKIQNFIGWASSTVNSNTITDCTTGVYGYNIQGCAPFEVGSNQINIPTAGANSKPNSTGVRIANAVPNVDLPVCFNIHDNTIKRTSNGIWITYANSADIGYNHISSVSNLGSGSGVLQDGILVEASSVGSIHHNDVDGGDMNAWWMSGVRHENSANLVKGNTVQNIGRGLFFGGNCSGIIPAQNHMKNNFDGFFLNYATGLPSQLNANGEATEDTWEGTFVRSHTWAYNTIASVCTLNLKLPRCNPASGQCKDPFPFVRGNDPGPGFSSNISYAEVNTSSTKKTADPKRELYLNLAKDKIKFPVYDASAKWMCKYNVYYNLQAADSAYKTDEPELKLFADSVSGLNIGKVYNLNKLFAQGNFNTAVAQTAVNSLLAVNVVEQNLKDVYTINIANRNNNGLSKTEIKALQTIAKQCPYEGGYGVYNARVLLSTVDNTFYTNNCESGMADKSGLKLAQGGADTTGVYPGIVIYPNPAKDKLNAVIHLAEGQTGTLTVYDLAGKSVLSSVLVGNNITEISTAHLNAGIYIYKVNVNDAPVNTGKLSVIR